MPFVKLHTLVFLKKQLHLQQREQTDERRQLRRLSSTSLLLLCPPSLASALLCTATWPELCFGIANSGAVSPAPACDVRCFMDIGRIRLTPNAQRCSRCCRVRSMRAGRCHARHFRFSLHVSYSLNFRLRYHLICVCSYSLTHVAFGRCGLVRRACVSA